MSDKNHRTTEQKKRRQYLAKCKKMGKTPISAKAYYSNLRRKAAKTPVVKSAPTKAKAVAPKKPSAQKAVKAPRANVVTVKPGDVVKFVGSSKGIEQFGKKVAKLAKTKKGKK